jgi:NAD(P)-dependent dehydrogenase (short-subunit alcohol dehydrogenase family)
METVLITGANRGIGLALAQQHAARGDRVIGACRHDSEALQATGARIEAGVDVTDAAALGELAKRLDGVRINRLWLNAGVLGREKLGGIDVVAIESLRHQFEVNTLGPLLVTQALMDFLVSGAKVGIMTSRMGSISDNDSGGYYGYRASKAAVNAVGKSLAVDLRPRGVAVFLFHPGYVATDMVGGKGDIAPELAAERLVGLLDELDIEDSGSFWHSNGSALPW